MYERILVPTDGSDAAVAAVDTAIALARRFDAEVHGIHVVDSTSMLAAADDTTGELVRRGKDAVAAVADRATDADVDATTTLIEEATPPHRGILAYADDHDIDLVVMGTHGRTGVGRVILGSVTARTLREASIPVMTVHEETVIDSELDSLLVPFDGSAGAQAAADHAIELAQVTDATVNFVHVVHPGVVAGDVNARMILEALEEAGERALETVIGNAERAGVETGDAPVLVGKPHREIVAFADEQDIDCIVMGTHGRTGLGRFFLGSVTERVIRKSEVPVIATRADEQPD